MSDVPPPVPQTPQPVNYMPGQQAKTDGVSIAGLVTGILGFCVPGLGIVGIVLGAMGMSRTGKPGVGGRGLAIAGLVCGIVSTLLMCVQISILLPSLNRARETANRVRCASNLKQIGQAMLLYTLENRNNYPPDFATVLKTQDIAPQAFFCPSSASSPAATPFTDDVQARANHTLDYVYVGEGLTNSISADEPIAFERLSDHDQDGGNVLFGDGRVEFIMKPAILKLLAPLKGTPRLTQEEHDAIVAP